jgi:hypothetical protein
LSLFAIAFPRIAILLLWFFTSFFNGVYRDLLLPVLGFVLLPLTLIVYTYLRNTHSNLSAPVSLVLLFIAVILDLGLVGGGRFRRSRAV